MFTTVQYSMSPQVNVRNRRQRSYHGDYKKDLHRPQHKTCAYHRLQVLLTTDIYFHIAKINKQFRRACARCCRTLLNQLSSPCTRKGQVQVYLNTITPHCLNATRQHPQRNKMSSQEEDPLHEEARQKAQAIEEYVKGRLNVINSLCIALPRYKARPTDTIVTTFPKAGTTLMQQMVYQIVVATGGAPVDDPDGVNFIDISCRVPWINVLPNDSFLPKGPQESSPRVFKSHSPITVFDIETHRHVVVIRDPVCYPGSYLNFLFEIFANNLLHSASELAREFLFHGWVEKMLKRSETVTDLRSQARQSKFEENMGTWFEYNKGWLDAMHHKNVLILFYEDVVSDPSTACKRIARFLERSLSDQALSKVVSRCTREYMSTGDRFKSIWDGKVCGVEPFAEKVKPFDRDGFSQFAWKPKQLEALKREMRGAFGVETYAELKAAVGAKLDQ